MIENSYKTLRSLYLLHIFILALGCLIGLILAYFFNLIEFDFSEEINKARDLGIVSISILNGYPETRDILTFISVVGFPVVLSIGLWFFCFKREQRANLARLLNEEKDCPKKMGKWIIPILIIGGFCLFWTFDINYFYLPAWNPYVKAWVFLGEEGENLAWAQSILSGGVYGKDFFCLYGPMLIYPLTWLMKVVNVKGPKKAKPTYY